MLESKQMDLDATRALMGGSDVGSNATDVEVPGGSGNGGEDDDDGNDDEE